MIEPKKSAENSYLFVALITNSWVIRKILRGGILLLLCHELEVDRMRNCPMSKDLLWQTYQSLLWPETPLGIPRIMKQLFHVCYEWSCKLTVVKQRKLYLAPKSWFCTPLPLNPESKTPTDADYWGIIEVHWKSKLDNLTWHLNCDKG